jgi:hypothetical protein
LNAARVSVTDIPVEHSVKLQDFDKWLKREGGTPRQVTQRRRIWEILGVSPEK